MNILNFSKTDNFSETIIENSKSNNSELNTVLKKYKINWALSNISETLDYSDLIIYELIGETANDSNSSKFREDITKWIVGLEASIGKHGYDDDFEAIEVKPKNYTGKTKLNGGGQFTDFTWNRDLKYNSDKVKMLISGFCFGKLVFIVEFDYSDIRSKIQSHLNRILPSGDLPNRYVRSASFSYLDWKDANYKIKYISENIKDFKYCMVSGLYNELIKQ